jgi:hypothetical protein
MSSLLAPLTYTSTLKQLWLRGRRGECPYNEFRLNGIPESLKTYVDQFMLEDGVIDHNRLVWTSENSFVRVGFQPHKLLGAYRNHRFELRLTSGSQNLWLYIYSTTLENAMSCLELLVGLHDDNYDEMRLINRDGSAERLCPLTSVLLEKVLLQNAKRKHVFFDMTFTPDQSRTLATSGTRTDIGLTRSKFEDDGEAFLEALEAREDPETGLAQLSIHRFPFAEGVLVLLLGKLESLTLRGVDLESEEACRAVAEAELQYLNLSYCELGDGGASLVESIREGHGPKGLGLVKSGDDDDDDDDDDWHPFDSSERFASFLNALRGNTYLERLDLSRFDLREEGILPALAAALFGNIGLIHLALPGCELDESGFCKVLRAISAHPSLRTLDLNGIELDMDATEAIEEVTKMLSVNTQLEVICIAEDDDDSPFDSLAWGKLVIPRLEYNIYRKRFPPIQNLRVPSTRAAVMAIALTHVSNKSSPAFMLLRQNGDILSSYPLRVDPQIATSS